MSILYIIASIALIGFLVWAITALVPMDEKFKRIIVLVAIIVVVLWLFQLLFGLPPFLTAPIGHR